MNNKDNLQEEYTAIKVNSNKVKVNKVNWGAILVNITPNFFLISTPKSCPDLLFIVYIYIRAL